MVNQFPAVRQSLEKLVYERQEQNRQRLATATSTPLDAFLTRGIMEAQSLLVMDLQRCTRCDACVRACADAHDGVTRLIREGQRFDKYLVATSCRHCRDPLCMPGCPVGAIGRRNSLEVIIENWCIGCGTVRERTARTATSTICIRSRVMENDPMECRPSEGRGKTQGDFLRSVHRSGRTQLRLCLSARCGASRWSRFHEFFRWVGTPLASTGLAERNLTKGPMRIEPDTPPLGDRNRSARDREHHRLHSLRCWKRPAARAAW